MNDPDVAAELRRPSNVEQVILVDRICRRFEDAWNSGRRLRVEDLQAEGGPAAAEVLLGELVALEVELRRSAGETPRVDEYLSRFPEAAAVIAVAFQDALSSGAPERRRDEDLPERFGDFRVLRELGRGGMGVVYEAIQESLGRRVAVKTLPRQPDPQGIQSRRLRREARAIARLHHSHIVDVFGHGEHAGVPFIAMRLVDGRGLDALIAAARQGTEPPHRRATEVQIRARQAARIGSQIADALHYAHQAGVLHRDVKPSNILLDRSGVAWLADFGLARVVHGDDAASLSDEGQLPGTLSYLPPERLRGEVDERGDIYSLGLTLYEFLTLQPAFPETDRMLRLKQISEGCLERLETRLPSVPRDLATILHKASEREPGARYQTAGQLADDLRRFLADEPIQARPLGPVERTLRWAQRNRRLAAALAAIAVLLAVSTAGALGAACYFRHLESQQRALAHRNHELARDKDAANRQTQRTLADMYTAYGMQASDDGRDREALLWFANAALVREHLIAESPPRDGTLAPEPARDALVPDSAPAASAAAEDDAELLRLGVNRMRLSSRRLARPIAVFRNQAPVDRLVIHPSGRYVLMRPAVGWPGVVWDVRTEQPVPLPPAATPAHALAWTPDGTRLAIGLDDRVLVVRFPELTEPEEISCGLAVPADPAAGAVGSESQPAPIERLQFDAAGRYLAIAGPQAARVWDAQRRDFTGPPLPHPAPIQCLMFSPDGRYLVTGSADDRFRLFAVTGDQPVPQWEGPHGTNTTWTFVAPRFTADGRQLVTRPDKKKLAVWDVAAGRLSREIPSPVGTIYGLEPCSPEGDLLVSGTGGVAVVHPLRDVDRPLLTNLASVVVAVDPRQQWAFVGRGSPECQLWSLPEWRALPCPAVHPEGCRSAAFAPDGRCFATAGYDHNVRLWTLPQPDPASLTVHVPGGEIHCGQFSPDSRYLAITASCPTTLVYDMRTGREVGRVEAPEKHAGLYAALLPDNERLAVYYLLPDQAGCLGIWNWRTGQRLNLVPLPAWPQMLTYPDLCVNPAGTRLVALGQQSHVQVFDMTTPPGRLLRTWDGDREHRWYRLSPDGQWLCGATRTKGVLWNLETGEVREVAVHKSEVQDATFSPDGRLLATASRDGIVGLWDLNARQPAREPLAHPASVYSAEFSPDGRYLLTICKDVSARVWDLARGQLAAGPITGTEDITARFRAGGSQLIVTDYEGRFEAWDWRRRQRLLPTERLFWEPCYCWNGMRSLVLSPDGRLAAVGGGQMLNVVNLAPLDAAALPPARDLVTEAEVLSHLRLADGSTANLTFEEWCERWQRLRAARRE